MKNLQASYNDDANKIIKGAMQDKVVKNLNFLIDLAMVTTNTMPVPEEPPLLIKLGIIPMQLLEKNGKKPFTRSLLK